MALRRPHAGRGRTAGLWVLVLPILLLQVAVIVGPTLAAIYYSLTSWNGFGAAPFVGLDNYVRIFGDPAVHRAFQNNLFYLMMMPVPITLGVVIASVLSRAGKWGFAYRLIYFLPYMLPSVVVAFIWRLLLSPGQGLGAMLASALSIPALNTAWLGNPFTALPAVWVADTWHWVGFLIVVFLAAISSVPTELYEAARLDGASLWQEFRYVTIPGIRPTIAFLVLMTSIWSFLVFDYVWLLTGGGPAGSSDVLGTIVVRTGILQTDAGYAAAIGLSMGLLAAILILVFAYLRRRGSTI